MERMRMLLEGETWEPNDRIEMERRKNNLLLRDVTTRNETMSGIRGWEVFYVVGVCLSFLVVLFKRVGRMVDECFLRMDVLPQGR